MTSARISILVAIALVTGLLLAVPAASHDAPNSCGSQNEMGAGWYNSYGHGVGCERTRRIARKWERKCVHGGGCPRDRAAYIDEWPGFRCRQRRLGTELFKVRCRAEGDRVVHFEYGS